MSTRCTSTGWACPTWRPDNTCSAVSAATAPTPRPAGPSSAHWPLTTARARACTAAYAPTTSLSGPSTLRYAIPSGAGRTLTRRDRTAASIRATTLAASSSAATRLAAPPAAFTPSRPNNGPTRASTSARSATLNVAVAWTTATATRSLHCPRDRAVIVAGISCTNARANPTNRSPMLGDSRRANATTDPTDRPTSCGATTSREQRSASVARACAADAAPFTRSSSATRSTRSRSDNEPTPTPASHPRNAATVPTAPAPVTLAEDPDGPPAPPTRNDATAPSGALTASGAPP